MSVPCVLIHYTVPDNPMVGASSLNFPSRTAVRCDIHHWHSDQGGLGMNPDGLCPFGRMEAQLDAALSEIERRLTALENASVPTI